MGSYDKSTQLYENILNEAKGNDDDELITNLSASYTMNGNFSKGIEITKRSDHNTYELAYNASCGSIGLKEYDQAEKYLEFSKKLCKADDTSELASIMVQLAYVKYLNGNVEESKKINEEMFNQEKKETVALAVAANNLVAIHSNSNTTQDHVLDAQKKLKYAYQDKLQGKLTTEQIKGVTLNNALLLLQMNKFEECEKVVQTELLKTCPNDELPILIQSFIYFKQKKFNESISTLENYISTNKSNVDNIQLALAQLYLQQGKYKQAIDTLKKSKFANHKSVESLLITLYMKLDDMNSALDLFQQVVNKYYSNDKSKSIVELATELAKLQLSFKKYKEAAATYELLSKLEPDNQIHTAGLIDALSYYDVDAAEKALQKLPAMKQVNVEDLEKTTAVSMAVSKVAATSDSLVATSVSSRQAAALNRGEKKKQRKKRRNKLPVLNVSTDATTVVDATRWESKKKQGSKEATGVGHQGSADVDTQKSLQHKKGQKTILAPEQVRGNAPASTSSKKGRKKR